MNKLKKLYTRIGNRILKTYRTTEFSKSDIYHENQDRKKVIINSLAKTVGIIGNHHTRKF